MRSTSLLASIGLLLVPAVAVAAKADIYALIGGKVVTVSGAIHEKATVVLRDGVIEAVGPQVQIPADARVIDVKGLTVTPGLIDAFGGLGLPAPPRSGSSSGSSGGPSPPPEAPPSPGGQGSTAAPAPPVQPHAMAFDKLRPAEALKARDGGLTTALVIAREGVLPGRSVLVNLSGAKADAMVLRQPAALHLHMSTASRAYPSSLMGTVALARQQILDAVRYRDEWAAYERSPLGKKRPRYDAGLAAWQEVLAGRQMLIVTATRENDIRRALALGDELKVRVGIAGAPQAFRLTGLLKTRRVPLFVSVNFDPPRATGGFGGGGTDDEKEKREIAEAERNPAQLHKAGIPFALVSGHAPSFSAGVRKAIDSGLPREAALKALTLHAAQALGVADRLGSIDKGKIANLVVWTGEPLVKGSRPRWVFVDGQIYEPEPSKKRDDAGPEGQDEEKRPDTEPVDTSMASGDQAGQHAGEDVEP